MTLEELLNKCIQRGWKPFGILGNVRNSVYTNKYFFFEGCADGVTLRQIVSKESGLWQFVCDREHRFIDKKNYDGVSLDKRLKNPYVDYDGVNTEYGRITSLDYQYWLIESSLKDESELESFILENIKIGND